MKYAMLAGALLYLVRYPTMRGVMIGAAATALLLI